MNNRLYTYTMQTCIVALCIACFTGRQVGYAAEIAVYTEYIYPTTFTVVGGGVAANGWGGVVAAHPAVEPGGFQTRNVGVIFQAEASVVDLSTVSREAAAFEQHGKNGNTELMIAAATGDDSAVAQLLKKPSVSVNAANQFGSTALMGAAAGGYSNIVNRLIQRGALVNAKSRKGSTALIFAAKNGHEGIVRKLLSAGAAVDVSDEQGQTALMYAVGASHVNTASMLTTAGANVNIHSRTGASPLQLASNAKNQDLVVLLTRCGAK